jgi:glycosyltransferase involved in cell wall biosynthesis
MSDKAPKVFVGIPICNEEKHIGELLESIHLQDYTNMVVLISDNASTDNTWSIVSSYLKKDNRFSAIKQTQNIGASANFEYVLEQSSGEYFIFAGGHDIWGKDMIQTCVGLMESDQSITLVAPKTTRIDSDGKLLESMRDENIDTRLEKSSAGRAYTFWNQINRCSCFYGLFKRDYIVNNYKTPKIVNADFYILINAAAAGNVVTASGCCWYRRVVRSETRKEQKVRYNNVLNLNKLSRRFPLIISRTMTLLKIFSYKGSLKERLRLVNFTIVRYFISRQQFKLLIKELFGVA